MGKLIWKNIRGTKGYYSVSNNGDIRRNKKRIKVCNHFLHDFRISKYGIIKGGIVNGYKRFELYLNSKLCIRDYAHRLVAKAFIKNKNKRKNKIINHIDGNKLNNSYKNIEWCTYSQNLNHAFEIGLRKLKSGEKRIPKND